MASPAVERLKGELARVRSSAASLRRSTSGKGAPAMQAGSVLAGSALAAVIDTKVIPGGLVGQPASGLVGAALVLGGIFLLKGKTANYAILGGSGMLAPVVNGLVADQMGGGVSLSEAA